MSTLHALRFNRRSKFIAGCVAVLLLGASPAGATLRTDVYVSGLSLPVAFVQDPSNAAVQYVVEQRGRIRVIVDGQLSGTDLLDLSGEVSGGSEQGLLGLAFSPDYATTGRFFVNYTDASGNTVIARFKRSATNPLVADPATRFHLRWPGGLSFIVQPFANHNGGTLAFGPDGYLYIGLGDGGSGGDPFNYAQDPNSLLGKMLRIDVSVSDSDPEGYDVPPDNPFVDSIPVPAFHEIWAFGLRNPWKFSFDDWRRGGTGALIMGDVGQGAWEEINYEPAGSGGRNYGWRILEGRHPYLPGSPPAYLPLTEPIYDYDHGTGQSVTGGYVYRGTALGSTYVGRYFFADFIAGRVWSMALAITPGTAEATVSGLLEHTTELGGTALIGPISSFGVDANGELYIVSYGTGRILRVLPERVTLSTSTVFAAPWGAPITWTASVTNTIAPVQYRFLRLNERGSWVLAQDYSASDTFTWTPGPAEGGRHLVQVWTRNAGSTAPFDNWGTTGFFDVIGAPPVSVTSFTASVSLPSVTQVPITWTAAATGGIAQLQYQFWRLKQGSGWTLVQDYGSSHTFTWTPGPSEAGTYLLQVWVRSTGSTAPYDAWTTTGFFQITDPPPVTVTSFTSNTVFPSSEFVPITWTVHAAGGGAPLLYQFWRLKQGFGWTLARDYSRENTLTWMPIAGDAGSYVVQVWVKATGSPEPFDAWSGMAFSITRPAPARLITLTASVPLPVPANTPITWSASAVAGVPPLQFKFYLLDATVGQWTLLQDYSPAQSVTWLRPSAGTYLLQVWVRSGGSIAAYEDWSSTGYFMIGAANP